MTERLKNYWKLRQGCGRNYWEKRILAELDFLYQMFTEEERPLPEEFYQAADTLYARLTAQGGLAEKEVKSAEELLAAFSAQTKSYRLFCAAHAHIDMNWMWGMPETVAVVIDTFQTMLNLLEEYPDFIFSQSQASTYAIVEKYAPSLLPQIRKYVQEGRWEVTAASWVEADKNMSGTEAAIRQIMYTKEYMQKLLGVPAESLQIDFEPDTFGHGRYVPEILSGCGIKYYFHCRGNDQEEIYRWRVPSGKELLVYREPNWYLGPVEYEMASYVPAFCKRNKVRAALRVYGVGDHGGGPTRRDLERIMDMRTWPLLPEIRFAKFAEYFQEIEKTRENYPVVERELNYIFTGCYSSQSRLKAANRIAEDRYYDAEALMAMEFLCGEELSNGEGFKEGWKKILFNQFHDILPGSCVEDSVSYSLGQFQESMSYAVACANRSMKAVGAHVDTSLLGEARDPQSTSEGAGVGYNIMATPERSGQAGSTAWKLTEASRGQGSIRVFTLFNTTQYTRKEPVEITLWDWKIDLDRTALCDGTGKERSFDRLEEDQSYWQHSFHKLLFMAEVPPFGYANYYFYEKETPPVPHRTDEPRVHRMEDGCCVLENQKVKAVFATDSMKLTAFIDKEQKLDLLGGKPSGYFRYIREEDTGDYSAWMVGGYRKMEDLNESCRIQIVEQKSGALRQWITYRLAFRHSSLEVKVILDEGSDMLRYCVRTDWHETGSREEGSPQLQFYVPFGYASEWTRYDVSGGVIDRKPAGHDVPAIGFAAPAPLRGQKGLMVTSDCKYGYRTEKGALTINLLRASHNPDPYPDQGRHLWELGLGICSPENVFGLSERAVCFSHPVYAYSNDIHKGELGQKGSFLQVEGNVRVTAWKKTEDGKGLLLRCQRGKEQEEIWTVSTPFAWKKAKACSSLEKPAEELSGEGKTLRMKGEAETLVSVKMAYK